MLDVDEASLEVDDTLALAEFEAAAVVEGDVVAGLEESCRLWTMCLAMTLSAQRSAASAVTTWRKCMV